jgi:TRAP-type C4-dicarboxylate transport system, small permease component
MGVKRIFHSATVFFEEILPALCFAVIFVAFMIGILSRYILRVPVVWTYEISILAYMWTTFFGASYAFKKNEHVVFGLVYDGLGDGAKRCLRILYNLLAAFFMGLFFYPATMSILSKTAKTGSLLWPQKYVFLPFAFMLFAVTLRAIHNIYVDVKGGRSDAEEGSDAMLLEKARRELEGGE